MTSWIDHVRENHGRAQEYIVFTFHPGINRYIILYLHVVTQYDMWRYDDVLPDITALADFAIGHDVAKVPYACAVADLTGFVDVT
jgi:hypothetical protein